MTKRSCHGVQSRQSRSPHLCKAIFWRIPALPPALLIAQRVTCRGARGLQQAPPARHRIGMAPRRAILVAQVLCGASLAMRIAYLLTSLGIGGAEKQVIALAERMALRGHAVVILTLLPPSLSSGRLRFRSFISICASRPQASSRLCFEHGTSCAGSILTCSTATPSMPISPHAYCGARAQCLAFSAPSITSTREAGCAWRLIGSPTSSACTRRP